MKSSPFSPNFFRAFSNSSNSSGSSAPIIYSRDWFWNSLKFISQLLEAVINFFKSQFKPGLYRAQWCIRFCGDFALAHALKKCKIDCLLLRRRQAPYDFADEGTRVAQQDFFLCGIMHPGIGLLFGFVLQAFLRARIS